MTNGARVGHASSPPTNVQTNVPYPTGNASPSGSPRNDHRESRAGAWSNTTTTVDDSPAAIASSPSITRTPGAHNQKLSPGGEQRVVDLLKQWSTQYLPLRSQQLIIEMANGYLKWVPRSPKTASSGS